MKRQRGHDDWRPLWDRGSRAGRHERARATHVFSQLVQLVELLHARCLGDAAGVVAQLMRDISHLGSAVAQAGVELLRQPGMEQHRMRFARSTASSSLSQCAPPTCLAEKGMWAPSTLSA